VKYLFFILFILYGTSSVAQITYQTVFVDYDSAWQYKNLKVIPIRMAKSAGNPSASQPILPNVISLSDALTQGLAKVSERGTASTENVHWLRINNNSDKPILINAGEIIAGGRQDRMVSKDTILIPNHKDQYFSVMCVEEERWSDKEKIFEYSNYANSHLRKVLDETKNQPLIWREIANELEGSSIKNNTLAYLSRNADKQIAGGPGDEYFNFLDEKIKHSDTTIVGFVCVSGDKIIGSDIFASTNLFYGQMEPLLRGYIDDALFYGAPVTIKDEAVKDYMDKILTDEKTQQEFVSKHGKIFKQRNQVIHINTY
jgi:ARG/rhodanese/phosphatase superfamily protein